MAAAAASLISYQPDNVRTPASLYVSFEMPSTSTLENLIAHAQVCDIPATTAQPRKSSAVDVDTNIHERASRNSYDTAVSCVTYSVTQYVNDACLYMQAKTLCNMENQGNG